MKFQRRLVGRELRPRAARIDVSFDVLVRSAAGDFRARMVNLSASGFRLRSTEALEPGSEVTLEVAKLAPVRGLVRWTQGEDVGGVFTDPVIL